VWIIVVVVVGIAAVGFALLAWRRLADGAAPAAPNSRPFAALATSGIGAGPKPDPPALRRGIELALQVVDEEREPADVIVRAWLGLEETAEDSGIARRPAETPTEFTSRIHGQAFADDGAVAMLLHLYLRTRFGDHPATPDDVAAARTALQQLARTTPDSPRGAGPR
jgi:Domain of unknown function (DUF4129)